MKLPIKIKKFRYNPRRKMGVIGDQPGAIVIPDDALPSLISVHSYNEKELVTEEGKSLKTILDQFKKCPEHTHWIQVRGLGNMTLLEELGTVLNINPLVLEDISNIHQRPKFDDYTDYFFVISRVIKFTDDHELINHQFSAIVKDNII